MTMAANKHKPDGLDHPVIPKVMMYAGRAHVRVYRLTRGRIGGKWRIGAGWKKPVPTLLLDHVGRKSGKAFTTPLLYLLDGPDVVIVASQGGLPKNPQWYANLMAAPDTRVQIKGEVRAVHARTAAATARAALWPKLVGIYADFENYQAWTEREIPVVILSPR